MFTDKPRPGVKRRITQELVAEVAMDDDGVLVDIDEPQALTAFREAQRAKGG